MICPDFSFHMIVNRMHTTRPLDENLPGSVELPIPAVKHHRSWRVKKFVPYVDVLLRETFFMTEEAEKPAEVAMGGAA